MRKELFETGKSVDSAIDAACEKLGCSRDECEWEIIDLPRKGFFGLKNTPAKVRVSIEVPDEKPKYRPQPQKPAEKKTESRQKPELPKQENKPAERILRENTRPETVKESDLSEKEKFAKDYLGELMEALGLKADYVVTRENGGSCVNIVGEGLGTIIGRRGETLDAIQYLTGLVANRSGGDYLRLTVDCGDYRLKRKDTLEALAKKLASQVIKTNVSKTLEPMNPFERRIIHATVSEIEGVSSASIGEEPNRRVVITSPTARPAPTGGYRTDTRQSGERGGYNRSRGRGGDRPAARRSGSADHGERPPRPPRREESRGFVQPSSAVPDSPKKTPESEVITGVSFGKIDLE